MDIWHVVFAAGGPVALLVGAGVRWFDKRLRDEAMLKMQSEVDSANRHIVKCELDHSETKARLGSVESRLLAALEQEQTYRQILPQKLIDGVERLTDTMTEVKDLVIDTISGLNSTVAGMKTELESQTKALQDNQRS